ncbi:MAG: Uncharacterized protein CEN89_438 [Candidatus Berkelbacteria bacterium Licking1014_7]|uniref:Phosphoesterase RecJ domain-containing protein n=1 Tax=Candidatus Berkelbacteria bacterium Licking1014_7 TaxID=2017147 RepID=A0A554LIZ7_9BACT|nr:MAG: Uncharacterized protein CEN89_438 [Candidatus Berkelbacteria bacterium Licking1014_7]
MKDNQTQIIKKITDILSRYSRFLLVVHQFPDGDTLASSLALFIALRSLKKEVVIVCCDDIPAPFLFLPQVSKIKKDFLQGDWDAVLILDCGDLRRTGFSQRLTNFARHKRKLINIDHHPKNDLHKVANINLFDDKRAAVAELVYEIINGLGVEIKKEIATCLLTAIFTDTGGFMHSNTSPATLELAALLLRRGARLRAITQNITGSKSLSALKLWGKTLERLAYNKKYNLVYSVILNDDLRECNATKSDVAGVINLINTVPDARLVILFFQHSEHEIKVSIRTEAQGVNLSRLAGIFGGGGHKKAAGFCVNGKIFCKKEKYTIETV